MTSIEWFAEMVIKMGYISPHKLQKAKEMHYKEIMDSMQRGMEIQQKYNSRKGFRERNNLLNDKTNG